MFNSINACDVVLPGELLIGSLMIYEDIHAQLVCEKNNVRGIIDLSNDEATFDVSFECRKICISIHDRPSNNIRQHFHKCNKFIAEIVRTNKAVLVHCRAGISRSSSIVCAYLMHAHKMSLKKAINTVYRARNIIYPNEGFLLQLRDYEDYLIVTGHYHPQGVVRFTVEDLYVNTLRCKIVRSGDFPIIPSDKIIRMIYRRKKTLEKSYEYITYIRDKREIYN